MDLVRSIGCAQSLEDRALQKAFFYRIYPQYITIVKESIEKVQHRVINRIGLNDSEKQRFNGVLSKATKRLLRQRLSLWLSVMFCSRDGLFINDKSFKCYPTFLTLTLPSKQIGSDELNKRELLSRFIYQLQSRNLIKHYFWVSEKQKNGNIHFHVILDKYVQLSVLQHYWFAQLKLMGYVQSNDYSTWRACSASLQIDKVNNLNGACNYLSKYVSKSDNSKKISGRIYGMSDGIRDLHPYVSIVDSYAELVLSSLRKFDYVQQYDSEQFSIMIFKKNKTVLSQNSVIRKQFIDNSYILYKSLYMNSIADSSLDIIVPVQQVKSLTSNCSTCKQPTLFDMLEVPIVRNRHAFDN